MAYIDHVSVAVFSKLDKCSNSQAFLVQYQLIIEELLRPIMFVCIGTTVGGFVSFCDPCNPGTEFSMLFQRLVIRGNYLRC